MIIQYFNAEKPDQVHTESSDLLQISEQEVDISKCVKNLEEEEGINVICQTECDDNLNSSSKEYLQQSTQTTDYNIYAFLKLIMRTFQK
jgi:hypothetical protein